MDSPKCQAGTASPVKPGISLFLLDTFRLLAGNEIGVNSKENTTRESSLSYVPYSFGMSTQINIFRCFRDDSICVTGLGSVILCLPDK
jgi:hypothetical protein